MKAKQLGVYDVVVAGGGPAGVTAALAAGRQGMKTLIVEQNGFLGGLAASGLPLLSFHTRSGKQICRGIAQEIIDRLYKLDGSPGHILCGDDAHMGSMTPIYPEEYKYLMDILFREEKIQTLLHAKVTGVVKKGKAISKLLVAIKEGLGEIEASCFIDASGDADLVAYGGGDYETGRSGDNKIQSMTSLFNVANVDEKKVLDLFSKEVIYAKRPGSDKKALLHIHGGLGRWKKEAGKEYPFKDSDHGLWAMVLRKGQLNLNIVDIIEKDGLTSSGLTEAEIDGRKQIFAIHKFLKKYVGGFEESFINFSHCVVGVRETRRIKGVYTLTKDDVISCRKFDDAIARSAYSIDMHDPDGKGIRFEMQKNADEFYDIPYRCLVPAHLENVIVAGRSISAEHEALASCRVMVFCMAMGEAAGVAAGIAVKNKQRVRDVNVTMIQRHLAKTGALLGL
jgi:hypothetical protein